jgi:A1 cistron-splicing factor AAR2
MNREVSSAEIRIQRKSLPEFEDRLDPYDLSNSRGPGTQSFDHSKAAGEWRQLTSCMKGALLTKIMGHEWNHWEVSSTHDHKPAEGSIRPKDSLGRRSDEVLCFIFPKANRTFSITSRGRERTEQAMDTSSHIKAIVTSSCTYEDSDEIIGELQFCYLTGMILGNAACMEHCKAYSHSNLQFFPMGDASLGAFLGAGMIRFVCPCVLGGKTAPKLSAP